MVNFIRKQNYNYGNNINIEYDINGFASTDFVKIGNQYEHKVVKLNFNLTPLINPFSIDELRFKLFFYDTNNIELSFDFNGFCFYGRFPYGNRRFFSGDSYGLFCWIYHNAYPFYYKEKHTPF